jgi:hypothetical protein
MSDAPGGGDVKIGGQSFKKSHVMIAVAGVGGVALLYYMRQRNASTTASTTSANASTGVDAAGYAIGSPEDLAYEAQLNGDYGSSVSGDGSIIGYDSEGNPVYGNGGTSGTPVGPGNYTSNAQWAQAFEQQVGSSGNDATAAALGKYLTGQSMTADQVTIVQEAIASQGYPPVSGPSGNPPGFKTSSPSLPAPSTKPGKISGLRVISKSATNISVSWNAATGATSYQVAYGYPSVSQNSIAVGGTSAVLPVTKGEKDIHIQVTALNDSGSGPHSTPLVVTGI